MAGGLHLCGRAWAWRVGAAPAGKCFKRHLYTRALFRRSGTRLTRFRAATIPKFCGSGKSLPGHPKPQPRNYGERDNPNPQRNIGQNLPELVNHFGIPLPVSTSGPFAEKRTSTPRPVTPRPSRFSFWVEHVNQQAKDVGFSNQSNHQAICRENGQPTDTVLEHQARRIR